MTSRTPHPCVHPLPQVSRSDGACCFSLMMEITTPDGSARVPTLDGWRLRAWPVARLGDVTLEAQALSSHLAAEDLRQALRGEGYRILGPIRTRRWVGRVQVT